MSKNTLQLIIGILIILILIPILYFSWLGAIGSRAERSAAQARADMEAVLVKLKMIPMQSFQAPTSTSLKDRDGRPVQETPWSEKASLVVFWTTWCENCEVEIQSLKELAAKQEMADFNIVMVNHKENKYKVGKFLGKYNLTLPTFLDANGQVADQFQMRFLPTAYVIDKNGTVLGRAEGPRPWEHGAYSAFFRWLMNQPVKNDANVKG